MSLKPISWSQWRQAYAQVRIQMLLMLRKNRAALLHTTNLLHHHPHNLFALRTSAHLLALFGDKAAAVTVLEQTLAVAPDLADSWFNLGYLHEALGRYQSAADAFHRATQLNPLLDRAWYGLGLCLIRLGRLTEAIAALDENTRLQPLNPAGWYQLARAHADNHSLLEAQRIVGHLRSFEPHVAAQLNQELATPPADACIKATPQPATA